MNAMAKDPIRSNIDTAIKCAQRKPPAIAGRAYFGAAYFLGVDLRDCGITEDSAKDIALQMWNNRCKPPMHPEHLARIINDCFHFKPDRKS
jgi:hypothetical protein